MGFESADLLVHPTQHKTQSVVEKAEKSQKKKVKQEAARWRVQKERKGLSNPFAYEKGGGGHGYMRTFKNDKRVMRNSRVFCKCVSVWYSRGGGRGTTTAHPLNAPLSLSSKKKKL